MHDKVVSIVARSSKLSVLVMTCWFRCVSAKYYGKLFGTFSSAFSLGLQDWIMELNDSQRVLSCYKCFHCVPNSICSISVETAHTDEGVIVSCLCKTSERRVP